MNDFRLRTDVRPRRYDLRFDLDLQSWRSTGSARIDLVTATPVREIVLHALDLDIGSARIDGEGATDISYDVESQTATLAFASEVAAGEHSLDIEWRGEIIARLRGLYRSVRGEERYAATQFESADARRAFPCFDEPEFKARFRVELTHPTGLTAIANGPIEAQTDLGEGRTRTRFGDTPPISSYLVAFTVGPYEGTPAVSTASGAPVRVWVPPGLSAQAIYARDAHVRAIDWLEAYTGITYPYRKVDSIGLPDFDHGAMENPGAITYRLVAVAADRRTASTAVLKYVFSVVAHELTHMWWGDLVTMRWWNDLWLNESFASFVGEKATSALNPEWGYERDVVQSTGGAFGLDSLATTHPVSMEVRNADEADQRIDAITYEKGLAVLRMVEGYLGADTFRSGVRLYLDRFREANATADDFWSALDETSRQDVTPLAHAWIRDPGHPLVRCGVREVDGGLQITLRQDRFYADPDLRPGDQSWPVPMVIVYGTREGRREKRVLLGERERTLRLPGATWYFPNGGASGFYRYAFDDRSIALLVPAVAGLPATERLSLLGDTWALVRARRAGIAQLVGLISALGRERDRAVLQTLGEIVAWLSQHAVGDATRPAFRAFVRSIFRTELDALGWTPRADDTFDERQARVAVLSALGSHAEEEDVRREARRRVEAHLSGERQDPDVIGVLASIAARDGDGGLFDRYVARMKESQKTDAQEESRFRAALTQFTDPAIVRRAIDLAFSDAIRDQDRTLLLPVMLGSRYARADAWEAVRAHWAERVATLDSGGRNRMVNGISQLSPRALAEDAIAFLEAHRTPEIGEVAAQTIERLRLLVPSAERIAAELPGALERVMEQARA